MSETSERQQDANFIIDFLFNQWSYWQNRAIEAEKLVGELSISNKFDFHLKGQDKCRKHIEKLANQGKP